MIKITPKGVLLVSAGFAAGYSVAMSRQEPNGIVKEAVAEAVNAFSDGMNEAWAIINEDLRNQNPTPTQPPKQVPSYIDSDAVEETPQGEPING